MRFIIRWIVTALAVAVAVWLIPGIEVVGAEAWVGVVLLALILSLVNIVIKPIVQTLSLPISVLTLGLFYIVVNTLLLYLAVWLANNLFDIGFEISSFGSAFVASIVISVVSVIVNMVVGRRRK